MCVRRCRPGRIRRPRVRLLRSPLLRGEGAHAFPLHELNGYAPASAEEQDLDSELDRRLAQAAAR